VLGLDSMTYRVFFLYFVLILGADSGGLEVGTDGLVFFFFDKLTGGLVGV